MTQKDKHLLLVDLSARLPYGVIGHYYLNKSLEWGEPERLINMDLINERFITQENDYAIEEFIVFLRPMSSMTEEEKEELEGLNMNPFSGSVSDWLNAHHLDYRNLIERGLAIEVTKENNPYKINGNNL